LVTGNLSFPHDIHRRSYQLHLAAIDGVEQLGLDDEVLGLDALGVLGDELGAVEVIEVRNVGADVQTVDGDRIARLKLQLANLPCPLQKLQLRIADSLTLRCELDAVDLGRDISILPHRAASASLRSR
jgi:hypothetical protein